MKSIETVMRAAPVIPVLVVDDPASAVLIAEALVAGGLPIIEVTLRIGAAIDIVEEIRSVPGAMVGAGTVLNPGQLDAALRAEAEFIVSPGLTGQLGAAVASADVPFLPGIANSGDITRGPDLGLTHFKFFPAIASGGLSALAGVFREVKSCPTGRHNRGIGGSLARPGIGAVRRRELGGAEGRAMAPSRARPGAPRVFADEW